MEGSWELETTRRTVEVPKINTFRIECSKRDGVCREYLAKLITPEDDPLRLVKDRHLFLMVEDFKVTYWDGKTITAKAEPRAADIFLEVSLQLLGAVRTSQETEVRGAKGARKTSDRWVWR